MAGGLACCGHFLARGCLAVSSQGAVQHFASGYDVGGLGQIGSAECAWAAIAFQLVQLGVRSLTRMVLAHVAASCGKLLFPHELLAALVMALSRARSSSLSRWTHDHLILVFHVRHIVIALRCTVSSSSFLILCWRNPSSAGIRVSAAGWLWLLMNIGSWLRVHLHIAFKALWWSSFL